MTDTKTPSKLVRGSRVLAAWEVGEIESALKDSLELLLDGCDGSEDTRTEETVTGLVRALTALGCSVQPLSGRGVPDLLVGIRGRNFLLECKAPLGVRGGASGRGLNEAQEAWARSWRGDAPMLARTTDDAVAVILDALGVRRSLVPVATAWDDDLDVGGKPFKREGLAMGGIREALTSIAANEATGDTGVGMTRGAEKLAREDYLRGLWLDEQLVEQRVESRRVKATMRMSTYRRRKTLVPA